MRKSLILLLPIALSALGGCGSEQSAQQQAGTSAQQSSSTAPVTNGVDKNALVAEAKEAVMALAGPLQTQLQAAMQAGGPASAVEVCHKIAPAMARGVSADKGVEITRVSLKNRNPVMGLPNDWQTAVLEDFEARKLAGEDAKTISYAEVVDNQFRFMKAVPTAAVCLNCHGTDIKPAVATMIEQWYPDDKATGFKEGDIRGAFVVTKAIAQ